MTDRFSLRRAIERLRDGLFDPIAVDRLTVDKERVDAPFVKGLDALERGASSHLCICGSYGQGKSHTLAYLKRQALSQGFATSTVQLDLREVPFHQFSIVYQSIMQRLCLPDGQQFVAAWKDWADKDRLALLDGMPHRFKMALTAMLSKNKRIAAQEEISKQPEAYPPKEYGDWLEKVLMGHDIPLSHLKSICRYREVAGYREDSLLCRGNDSYFQMVQSLAKVLKEMGYKGLLLFFDEAEAITQGRVSQRAKSYPLLDQFFRTKGSLFPIFAFTNDFFDQVRSELYDNGKETFVKNYAEEWQDLNILHLQDFSSHSWDSLLDRLMQLYSHAYQIDITAQIKPYLQLTLAKVEAQETRFKLKALVHKLDVETQHLLLQSV